MGRRLRRHRRVAVDVGSGNGSPRVRDISIGGARLQWTRALRIDDSIELELPLRHGQLRIKGCVVRARRTGLETLPYEYGVMLEDLTSETHEELLRFIEEHGIDEEPTSMVESNQLVDLQDRIAELERQLAAEVRRLPNQTSPAQQAQTAAGAGAASTGGDDELHAAHTTHYDLPRFSRLLEIGQPLVRLTDDAAVLGEYLPQPLADIMPTSESPAGEEGIDLPAIRRMLRGISDPESITTALFRCYEHDLIDFA